MEFQVKRGTFDETDIDFCSSSRTLARLGTRHAGCHTGSFGRQNPMRRAIAHAGLLAAALTLAGISLSAQTATTNVDLSSILASQSPGPPAVLEYNNRPITTFRATVLSRTPADRADAIRTLLDRLISAGPPGPVSSRELQGVNVIVVGGRDVFGIVPQDIDTLAGETAPAKTAEAVRNLQRALDEAIEMHTPAAILRGAERSVVATVLFLLLAFVVLRVHRRLAVNLPSRAEQQLQKMSPGAASTIVVASRATYLLRLLVTLVAVLTVLFLAYAWLTFVLRSFPYTRPWGESLRAFLIGRFELLALKFVHALPQLFTALVILLTARLVVKASNLLFEAAEQGRAMIPWVYPETAQPTRRLMATLLWLIGFVVAYPYLPGSDSEAFKGVSVFIGLMISLGSSSVVNQMMSGLTITYSRSLRVGEFVRVGEVEGTVTNVGALSTKIKTSRGEEVTIPNAVVVSHITTNYSRYQDTDGVFFPTSVTIGYDTPWRQVHALLLLAAERTPGVRKQPPPVVRQTALQDFYVQYTLLVSLEHPSRRLSILDRLHASIQDAFNEFDVQIMSPNYEADPEGRKTVPRDRWFAAPAPSKPEEGMLGSGSKAGV
jgi:small-conductance mechanosensitive channel